MTETLSFDPRHPGRYICRRGNTMILVVGILVLLVIIATSFVSRTHADRMTAISLQKAAGRLDRSRSMGSIIAGDISGALFVRPVLVDLQSALPNWVASSNAPRQRTPVFDLDEDGRADWPVRYGVSQDRLTNNTLLEEPDGKPDYPWNFAPYWVVPFTNWPDPREGSTDLLEAASWPKGPGNPAGGTASLFLFNEGNPKGNPGFGDSRWLADLEPVRVTLFEGNDGQVGTPDDEIIYSHYRHMTNLSRPDNGLRICRDISDVTNANPDVDVLGGVVTDLSIPVEQFLTVRSDMFNQFTGRPGFFDPWELFLRWRNWFQPVDASGNFGYRNAYFDPQLIPPNFLNLRDLDGNGFPHDWFDDEDVAQESPESEFVPGTARHTVGRFLADTDGDGYTDSFWHAVPGVVEPGVKQILAVRVIDNGAMLNANVATRFVRADDQGVAARTVGETPADLALVGELEDFITYPSAGAVALPQLHRNVGFLDNPAQWHVASPLNPYIVRYGGNINAGILSPQEVLWRTHLEASNLLPFAELFLLGRQFYLSRFIRKEYWRWGGMRSLNPYPRQSFTPFGIPDEIELRMFAGNNYPWVYSRLESTTQVTSFSGTGFLRGSTQRVESAELQFQLRNMDLVRDSRHRMTVYNGARNDLLPPWLWPSRFPTDVNQDMQLTRGEMRQFVGGRKKLDLRRQVLWNGGFPQFGTCPFNYCQVFDVDRDGVMEHPAAPPPGNVEPAYALLDDDLDDDGEITYRDHLFQLRNYLEHALIEADGSYMDMDAGDDEDETRKLAAAFAANIDAYRDQDSDLFIAEAVPLSDDDVVRYLGMERQPFLTEALVAHVYKGWVVPGPASPSWTNWGAHMLYEGIPSVWNGPIAAPTSFVVVQLANPYDEPLDLTDYILRIFGMEIPLGGTIAPNDALNVIGAAASKFGVQWRSLLRDRLGLDAGLAVTIEMTIAGGLETPLDRSFYDNAANPGGNSLGARQWDAIELVRLISESPGSPGLAQPVIVDRIDIKPADLSVPPDPDQDMTFGDGVTSMRKPEVLTSFPPPDSGFEFNPPSHPWFPDAQTHVVIYTHAKRAWEDPSGVNDENRNPRFVFADRVVAPKLNDSGIWDIDDVFSSPGYVYFTVAPGDPDELPGFDIPGLQFGTRSKDCDGTDTECEDRGWNSGMFDVDGIFSMQMLQKDADFEQVGELLNVWLFGHEIEMVSGSNTYVGTTQTFSEFMALERPVLPVLQLATDALRTNRLRTVPTNLNRYKASPVIGIADPLTGDVLHAVPSLPAGMRVMDLFVCDGPGLDGVTPGAPVLQREELWLARGFSGEATPGLINVNTAPHEVLRALPQMTRAVHETGESRAGTPLANLAPRVHVAEAIVGYRDRTGPQNILNDPVATPEPDYTSRDSLFESVRVERGIASLGELLFLTEPGNAIAPGPDPVDSWRIDFAAMDLFEFGVLARESARLSTDVIDKDDQLPPAPIPTDDQVAGDVEEANLFFAGLSNLVTTRSDVFTVYFRIRSFRQNDQGVWDATDREFIVDDSRYVMLVDRSEVNVPTDKPRIVYLEKLPK